MIWLYTWYREDKGPSPDELGAAVAQLALTGFARPPKSRGAAGFAK